MPAAIVNVCVDPRLNHEELRRQIADVAGPDVPAGSIFITNEPAGNYGTSARETVTLFHRTDQRLALAAILHHDDCLAAAAGMRHDIADSAKAFEEELRRAGFAITVLTGRIVTATSTIVWTPSPPHPRSHQREGGPDGADGS